VVGRNDSAARHAEGLAPSVGLLAGEDAATEVFEGGLRFGVDPLGGQKTGWFFDQRHNRDRVAALASGARVLDVCCCTGAFGLRCAAAGAAAVTLLDASQPALDAARAAAELNGLAGVSYLRADAFDALEATGGEFDIVVCDPPASCSQHAPLDRWSAQIAYGLTRAGRDGAILFTAGAGPDHPVHPHLPESAYLKAQLIRLT
jgi:23S rRNA (cytosine1962-C5)-methyltransferase